MSSFKSEPFGGSQFNHKLSKSDRETLKEIRDWVAERKLYKTDQEIRAEETQRMLDEITALSEN